MPGDRTDGLVAVLDAVRAGRGVTQTQLARQLGLGRTVVAQRVARLEAAGLMLPAGLQAIELAKANGAWTLLDDVENLVVPPDLEAAFAAHPGAREQWDAFPCSARRAILEWIVQARTEPTRAKRIAETAQKAAAGERANQWRPKA